ALIAWQRDNGYNGSGNVIIGSTQWNRLLASQSITAVRLRTPIMIGTRTTHTEVKTLQSFLDRHSTKDLLTYSNGVYDSFAGPSTISGLRQAQKTLGYSVTGRIGIYTMEWHHLRVMATNSRTERAGVTLRQDVTNDLVRSLQERLDRNKVRDYFSHTGGYTNYMGSVTVNGLKAWQTANGYPATGQITVRSIQWYHLYSQLAPVRKLDPRCYTSGVVICASKTDRKVYYVNKGKIIKTLDARFGGRNYDTQGRLRTYSTKEGSFTVTRKVRDEVSYSYGNTPMPFSVYFYGAQAFHYSYGFARDGWVGDWGSHGCVNLRSWSGAEWLFNNVSVGTRVVVYK
ncbi:MAG TPA: L,D-transpeptidase family protein, partial [Brevibacterium sp.]|nr:L,D-transpeptidase family protein [Brevibacterium sp.]